MNSELQTLEREFEARIELEEREPLLSREWLVTNGLGGYASGSVSGVVTRRYHGMLVAALPNPLGRTVMFTHLFEEIRLTGGMLVRLGGEELAEETADDHKTGLYIHGAHHLREFRLHYGMPVWRYEVEGHVIEKRILMPYQQNTVHVTFRLLEGRGPMRLRLRPSFHFLQHEHPVSEPLVGPYKVLAEAHRFEILHPARTCPPLRMTLHGGGQGAFVQDGGHFRRIFYRMEQSRGYDAYGTLYCPGYFKVNLVPGEEATLIGSIEDWETIQALTPAEAERAESERCQRLLELARHHPPHNHHGHGTSVAGNRAVRNGLSGELTLAADRFIITPRTRQADAARAHAAGDEVRSIIAGYHWFTDWGRDTMISLEGLTLVTGRHDEAGYILRTFAYYINQGLIPNMFPEGENKGLYHTADATLWYFHALDRYLEYTGDRRTLRLLLPALEDIVHHHLRGTLFNIHVDPADGLLAQGAEGYQLTWMDAKVGDWVVTPRRGKAVEINALWYNALRLLERWLREERGEDAARPIRHEADRVKESFNRRFWYEPGCYLYDVIDGEKGDDASLRPNQIFAIAMPHPVLAEERWTAVLETVQRHLLTPVGLRSLAPGDPEYKQYYYGDLRARDASYHQGTVWAWLIGPFIDAWIRVHPGQNAAARYYLEGFKPHLNEAGIGSISEIFDAEPPFVPRGCVAQAWSVAEVLRAWVKTEG